MSSARKEFLLHVGTVAPKIHRTGSGTLYAQVHADLLRKIQSGQLKVGDQLPTESELMKTFGVSRSTIRRALDELRRQEYIERKPAIGTFVSKPSVDAKIRGLHSLTDEVIEMGMTPGSRVIGLAKVAASKEQANFLGIDAGSPILKLDRVRTANEYPFFVATSYLNLGIYPELEAVDYMDPSLSLLDTYWKVLGQRPIRMSQLASATLAPRMAQEVFGISAGSPMLLLERSVYLEEQAAVEYVCAYFRGDSYKFYTELT